MLRRHRRLAIMASVNDRRETLTGGLTLVADRSTPRTADQVGRHRVEAPSKGADRDQQHDFDTDADTGIVPVYSPIVPARPRNPRWLWLIPIGSIVAGVVLGMLPFREHIGGPPGNAVPLPAPLTSQEKTAQPSTPPVSPEPLEPSERPSPSPPSPRPPAGPAATPTAQTSSPNPGPVLLGPSSNDGLETMVQRYCDRHSGGVADPRNDGRWQCRRLLTSSIADLDIACRDTHGSAAYARTSNADDPYAWRCYR